MKTRLNHLSFYDSLFYKRRHARFRVPMLVIGIFLLVRPNPTVAACQNSDKPSDREFAIQPDPADGEHEPIDADSMDSERAVQEKQRLIIMYAPLDGSLPSHVLGLAEELSLLLDPSSVTMVPLGRPNFTSLPVPSQLELLEDLGLAKVPVLWLDPPQDGSFCLRLFPESASDAPEETLPIIFKGGSLAGLALSVHEHLENTSAAHDDVPMPKADDATKEGARQVVDHERPWPEPVEHPTHASYRTDLAFGLALSGGTDIYGSDGKYYHFSPGIFAHYAPVSPMVLRLQVAALVGPHISDELAESERTGVEPGIDLLFRKRYRTFLIGPLIGIAVPYTRVKIEDRIDTSNQSYESSSWNLKGSLGISLGWKLSGLLSVVVDTTVQAFLYRDHQTWPHSENDFMVSPYLNWDLAVAVVFFLPSSWVRTPIQQNRKEGKPQRHHSLKGERW